MQDHLIVLTKRDVSVIINNRLVRGFILLRVDYAHPVTSCWEVKISHGENI